MSADTTKANKSKAKSTQETEQKIRIKIRAYDNNLIDSSAKKIIDSALRHGATIAGPVPLPTQVRKYTVNRSTFVHKTARDQYEVRIHKRIIDILNPTPKIIDSMMSVDLPSGVDVEVKHL